MTRSRQLLGLDIGEARTGVALGDLVVKIAMPLTTVTMQPDGFRQAIAELVTQHGIDTIVVGYPRNQSGEPTAQTAYVEARAAELADLDANVVFQDESLTSVLAEERLKQRGEALTKEAIDSEAATIILQDYLEAHP